MKRAEGKQYRLYFMAFLRRSWALIPHYLETDGISQETLFEIVKEGFINAIIQFLFYNVTYITLESERANLMSHEGIVLYFYFFTDVNT
jgi:hypothetical protein